MKKKTFLVVLLTFLISLSIFACGKVSPLGEYTDFNGVNENYVMSIDENMTIDGVLDEDVWANSKNKLSAVNGDKSMDVYAYLGENGVYFAFDVKDNSLFYNPGRQQSRNSGVEIYLTTLDHFKLEQGCVSIRLTPTGEGNEAVVNYYRPNGLGTEWMASSAKSKYIGAASVDGTVNSESRDSIGYTAEMGVSWELLGVEKADVVQYTASFIQTRNYDGFRDANTFLPDTSHVGVGSWKAVTNDGYVDDKYAFLDSTTAQEDDFMTIDGVLDEEEWLEVIEAGKGKVYTHNSSGITMSLYTLMTDRGVYIGLDSNDNDVYFGDGRSVKYNTGAELLIAANGTTVFNSENIVQIRYNVGGPGERYRGDPSKEYPYTAEYFPAKIGGSVKGAEMNTSEAEGWQGEIFLPWSSLGVTDDAMKNQIAVFSSIYHCEDAVSGDGTNWSYIAIAGSDVFANGSAKINPQESFFRFTKDKGFIPNGIKVPAQALGKNNLDSTGNYYEFLVKPDSYDAIVVGGFTTDKAKVLDAVFDFGEAETVSVTDNLDGTYLIQIPKADISYFESERIATVSADGMSSQFLISYDGDFALDGILDDNVYNGVKHAVLNQQLNGISVQSDFAFVLDEKAMYIGIKIVDANVNTSDQWGSGVEIYFNFGDTLSSQNTYQLRLYADATARYYNYSDEQLNADGFSWVENSSQVSSIYLISNIVSDGYVIEAKVPWSVFGLSEAPEKCGIASLTKFVYDVAKGSMTVRYDAKDIGNIGAREIENYLNWNNTGFAPAEIYADDVVFVKDINVTDGKYTGQFKLSYLPGGVLLVNDATFGDYADEVVAKGNGVYELSLPVDEVEAISDNIKITAASGEAVGSVTVYYIDANADDFDDSKILSYINFDDGLNALKGYDASMRRGTAEYGTVSDSYLINKHYTLNQNARALQLEEFKPGTDSFTVSMAINGDDILNSEYTASNGYAVVLFGTGSVDGNVDNMEGFSVRLRYDSTGAKANAFQMKVKETSFANDATTAAVVSAIKRDWQRWTFVFDRTVQDKLTITVYIDGSVVTSHTFDLGSDVSLDGAAGSVFGIGAPGVDDMADGKGYLGINIGIDDFMLYDGVMTQTDVYNMVQYDKRENEGNAFVMDDIKFNFTQLESDGSYEVQFSVNAYLSDGSVLNLDDSAVKFGAEIAEYISYNQAAEGNGKFTFAVSKDDLTEFEGGLTSTYTYNGRSKSVTVTYQPLEKIYVNVSEIELTKADKQSDGNYKFSVGVFADEGYMIPIEYAQFTSDGLGTPVYEGEGVYVFTVSASVIESISTSVVVTVSYLTAKADTFTVSYTALSADELAGIAAQTEFYLGLKDSVLDETGNYDATMRRGEAEYKDGAYVANMLKRAIKVDGYKPGTDSFTVSMMINGTDIVNYDANNGYAFVLFGTSSVDGSEGFSLRIRNKVSGVDKKTLQIKINGKTYENNINAVFSAIKSDWQRWTFVFDRSVRDKLTITAYIDGLFVFTESFDIASSMSLDGASNAVFGVGAPGIDESGWTGGGVYYPDVNLGMKEFILIGKALSEREATLIGAQLDEVLKQVCWSVSDKTIIYSDVTEGEDYSTTVTFNAYEDGVVISGAKFTGLPTDVTITETPGVYTLNIPADKIYDFIGGVEVTATIDGISKTFTITYVPLNELYLDVETITLYTTDKSADGYYNFDVAVYADASKTLPVTGVTFAPFTATDNGDGTYSFSIAEAEFEAESLHVITATKATGSYSAQETFNVNYIVWTADEIAENTEAYISFDGNLKNYAGSAAVTVNSPLYESDDDYSTDQVYVSNMKKRSAKLGVSVGTDSFVVSTMINGADLTNNLASSGYATAIVATGNIDGTSGFSIRIRKDTFQIKIVPQSTSDTGGKDAVWAAIEEEWQRWTFVFDRTVTDKLTIVVYIDGAHVYSKTFNLPSSTSLDVDGTLGIGTPGCTPDSNTYDYYTDANVRYDDFMFYRGYMNAKQVQAIDGYIESMKESTTFVAEDVLFDYNTPGIESGYTQDLVINKVYPQVTAITSDIAFDGVAADYISLSDGKYVLNIPAEDLDTFAVAEGVTVNYTYLGITKSFVIKYVKLDQLYVDEIEIFDLELNADDQIIHNVRVSADTEGLVGVGGVNFGEIASYVTEGETTGDYVITLTAEQAAALPSEIQISAGGINKTVKVSYNQSLVNNKEVLTHTGTKISTDTQGGKVFAGVELGTDSFTVSGTFFNLNKAQTGGGYALFSTANADFWDGITCYLNSGMFRFKFAGVQAGSSVNISTDMTKYTEWTDLVFQFDRSTEKSITITIYANGELVGSATQALDEDLTFDYGASKNFVLGGFNLETKGQTSSYTGAGPVDSNNFKLTSAAFAVTKGIVPISIADAYLNGVMDGYTIDASSVKADFGFNDGTTANSVSESGVAMELNAAAASSVVAGREGGEDKAIQINSKSMYYDVNGFNPGVNSFTVSMWLKMDFSTALTTNGSGIVLFATTDPAAKTGFAISVRKDYARLWIAAANNGVAIDNTAQYTDWTNWTFSFTRGNGNCVIDIYVNFKLAASKTVAMADDVSLSNPEKDSFMGIGRGVEVSGSEGGDYENGVFEHYENNTHTVDDIVIIDKELNAAEVLGLMNYYKA